MAVHAAIGTAVCGVFCLVTAVPGWLRQADRVFHGYQPG